MGMNRLLCQLLLLLPILLSGIALHARGGYADRLPLEVLTVQEYRYNSAMMPLMYRMDFAGSQINQADFPGVKATKFRQIDLVFTLYPKRPEDWKVGYDSLMERRFRTLEGRIPAAFQDPNVKWRLVIQTGCNSLEGAKELFHGFALYPADAAWDPAPETFSNDHWTPEEIVTYRFDTVKLREKYTLTTTILNGEKALTDSTVFKVWERHPEWKNALVVVDWTASMYKQGALLVRWQQEHLAEGRIRHFVFFNDGDQQYDNAKVVGATGGVYSVRADSLSKMLPTIEAVTMGGDGGDHRENNLEALLEGLVDCPECEQVIMLCDNTGPVRDMALLPEIDLPVRVLLCNAYKDKFETDYLEIADQTRGSLHTRDRDLEDISGMAVHGTLTIGQQKYVRKGKRWVAMNN